MTEHPIALTTAVFPGAGSAHLYHAVDAGLFAGAGLDVTLHEVTSSQEQVAGWNDGTFSILHTSPDHLLRGSLDRDATIVRAEAIGELSVYARSGVALSDARWAVDGAGSAFALVLRSVIADLGGVDATAATLEAVGGTPQRLAAMLGGDADGAVLHPPFDRVAEANGGFERIGGHSDVVPALMPVVVMVPGAELGSEMVSRYLETCERSAAALIEGGDELLATALERRGWPAETARAVAPDILGPAGLGADPHPSLEGLEAAARLRERWFPEWTPPPRLEQLLAR